MRVVTGADDITSANTLRAAILSACPILLAGMGGLWSRAGRRGQHRPRGPDAARHLGRGVLHLLVRPVGRAAGRGRARRRSAACCTALATITFGVDHIVSGVAINIIGLGATQYLAEAYFADLQNGGPRQLTGLDPLPYVTVPGRLGRADVAQRPALVRDLRRGRASSRR